MTDYTETGKFIKIVQIELLFHLQIIASNIESGHRDDVHDQMKKKYYIYLLKHQFPFDTGMSSCHL